MGLFGFGFGEPHTRAAAVGGQELQSFGKTQKDKVTHLVACKGLGD